MNWTERRRERFWTSSFYPRWCEQCANTQTLNKSQTQLSDSDRICNIYVYVCMHIHIIHWLFPNYFSVEYTFLNLNVSLLNSNKKLSDSDNPKFWAREFYLAAPQQQTQWPQSCLQTPCMKGHTNKSISDCYSSPITVKRHQRYMGMNNDAQEKVKYTAF